MIIHIVERFGETCVDPDDGGQLCSDVTEILQRGGSVCLDFSGVATVTSSFLNASIGCLYGAFDAEDLSRRLTWAGLDATDEAIVKLVQRNAMAYFRLSPSDRDRLAAIGPAE